MKRNMKSTVQKENIACVDTEKNNTDVELMQDLKCETCIYSQQCDGWEYAPFRMSDL